MARTYQLALTLHQKGQLEQARILYEEILKGEPNHVDALHMLGVTAVQSGEAQAGIDLLERSLRVNADQPAVLSSLGNALRSLNRPLEAIARYDRALALDPRHSPALNNRGSALLDLGRPQEALESYERALQVRPNHVGALFNYGNALLQVDRPREALSSYEQALRLAPDFAPALRAQARVLRGLGQLNQALAQLDRYLSLEPRDIEAQLDRATMLYELLRPQEAVQGYERALELDASCAAAHFGRGTVLAELGWHAEAAASLAKLVQIAPDFPLAHGTELQLRLALCDWSDWERRAQEILAGVKADQPVIYPPGLFAIHDSPVAHLQCARTYTRVFCPPAAAAVWKGERHGNERIRVAYASADFRDHPVPQLLAGVLERHDRERFEIIAVTLRPGDSRTLARRALAACDKVLDVSYDSEANAAEAIGRLKVDILVDLQGFTVGTRAGILARRPAPVQVSYLGFPGTMGAGYIDYLIADATVIPPGAECHYSEAIVRLPHCYLPFDSGQPVASGTPTRTEAGLPSRGFVFCAFNNHHKITPSLFAVWMRLLAANPESCLWLRAASPAATANLRQEAASRGVDPDRLVFAPAIPALEEHLARLRLADLFLDTLPYNAHATAANALWAGLPVLTCQGDSFAGRVGASLLNGVGLGDLVTTDLRDYEALASKLAGAPELLAQMRARLARNRSTCPLFDTERFCSHLEKAYTMMWERSERGIAPENLTVLV